jgi:hypothetical protein
MTRPMTIRESLVVDPDQLLAEYETARHAAWDGDATKVVAFLPKIPTLIGELAAIHAALRAAIDADGNQLWDEQTPPAQVISNLIGMARLRKKEQAE